MNPQLTKATTIPLLPVLQHNVVQRKDSPEGSVPAAGEREDVQWEDVRCGWCVAVGGSSGELPRRQ